MNHKYKMVEDYVGVLTERAKSFCRLAQQTLTDFSEVAIHDFRVSTRRLLIVESLLDSKSQTKKWKKSAKRLLKQLNQLRDLQVMQIRFQGDAVISGKLEAEIENEITTLGKLNEDATLRYIVNDIHFSIKTFENQLSLEIGGFDKSICSVWQKIRHDIDALLREADQHDYKLLHSLRVRYKSLRYLIEILLDAAIIQGMEIKRFKVLQDFLGNIQDLTVAIKWLEEHDLSPDIRRQLAEEMEQQRIAFWEGQQNLAQLMGQIDQCITDSALAC